MDAVAYPDSAVVKFVRENLVPLRIPSDDPELGRRFKVKWTPSLLILEPDGSEQYRTLGFYPPQELIPSLLLGMGKAFFNRPDRKAASGCFEGIIREFPNSSMAPEAIYLNGVSKYIETHEVSNLIAIYDRLAADYPTSPWLMRADPYRFLK